MFKFFSFVKCGFCVCLLFFLVFLCLFRRCKRSLIFKLVKFYVVYFICNVMKDYVFEIFSVYGYVKLVDLFMDCFNFMFRGFVYVEYDEVDDVDIVLKYMDGG